MKIPFISNLKKPACASKQDVLELATLQYVPIYFFIFYRFYFRWILWSLLTSNNFESKFILIKLIWAESQSMTSNLNSLGYILERILNLKLCNMYLFMTRCKFVFPAADLLWRHSLVRDWLAEWQTSILKKWIFMYGVVQFIKKEI